VNDYVEKWLTKADNDLKTAEHELSFGEEAVFDSVCFHCQQAVEKYLKAYLVTNNVNFGKSHNIEYLIELCVPINEDFKNLATGDLSSYAVGIRYPGDFYSPSLSESKTALKISQNVRKFILKRITPE